MDEVDNASPQHLWHRGHAVELAEPSDVRAGPDDPRARADPLGARGPGPVGGHHGLLDAERVESLGQPGGMDLHPAKGIESVASGEGFRRGLIHGAQAQDTHLVLPGHAGARMNDPRCRTANAP